MSNSRLRFKQYYAKQLKAEIITLRVDDQTLKMLKLICNKNSKTKSGLIREALWDLFSSKYPDVK